jgi:hypothetical protein
MDLLSMLYPFKIVVNLIIEQTGLHNFIINDK